MTPLSVPNACFAVFIDANMLQFNSIVNISQAMNTDNIDIINEHL